MSRTSPKHRLAALGRLVLGPEALLLGMLFALIEVVGPVSSQDDLDDVLWVVLPPALFAAAGNMARYRSLPLTAFLVGQAVILFHRLRDKLVLSLGLDFHPDDRPRLRPLTSLRRGVVTMGLVALIALPAAGLGRELLASLRVRGLYTIHVALLGSLWAVLLAGIVIQVPAAVLALLEVVKRRVALRSSLRIALVAVSVLAIGGMLVLLDDLTGLTGCLVALALGCLLPSVLRPIDPPRGPWLNIAIGRDDEPTTARMGEVLRDAQRLLALGALCIVAVLHESDRVDPDLFPVTDTLLRLFGWLAAWLFTGAAWLAVSEFNRRRRLYDPAFQRSKVLWALPGPEAGALRMERHAIERAGWRLVLSDELPGRDDADLLVGLPAAEMPASTVPLTRVPPALFLLQDSPGLVLDEAEERDKAERATAALERLLVTARPGLGDRGEGTFLVPHCWLVVGLTRDDDRGGIDRSPGMTFGQSFQAALGTRLRRFLFEVMHRAAIDVVYIEDAVTTDQMVEVLDRLFERHIDRAEPEIVSEHDFVGITGVRVVLHDVRPEAEGLAGVDGPVNRQAISRARIMIVGKDRHDGDDDDDPPTDGEHHDLWLKESLRTILPRVQPVG